MWHVVDVRMRVTRRRAAAALEDALTAAGVRHTCELYNGAAHGFTIADTAVYDASATEQHWERLLDLFARNLR